MKILISDPITNKGLSILKDSNFDLIELPNASNKEKAEACKDVQGWVIRSGTTVTAEMIESAKKLIVIGRAGVGVDNIDVEAATRHGVVVMNTPDVNTISAAEHTVAIILSLSRNIAEGNSSLKKGEWNRNALVGSELRNKTLGIIGLGKIGQEVLIRCRAFGMNVLGYDPYMNKDKFNPEEIKIVDLDNLTKNADYITVHVPLNDSTRDLFNYEQLIKMKPNARIVNVARGGIINEVDLAKVLNEGKIAGAAIDVYTSEPLEEKNPLLKANNILLTPHLGASTEEAKEGVSLAICEQIRDYIIDEKLNNAINMPISDMAKLKEIKFNLDLSELMGNIQGQLNQGSIKRVQVECSGTMDETKPAALAFLKGLLKNRVPDRVNYINAESIAIELGISIEHSFTNDSGPYTNLIRSRVSAELGATRIGGSVFDGNRIRLVNILGYEMEVNPYGTMLFMRNNDVPGVIGSVGYTLGKAEINIGAYLLSREMKEGEAFSVVRVDSRLSDKVLDDLRSIPQIISVQQLHC